ncbi:hypothetical protein ACFYRY_02105 [Streptomyces sp. NPDC005263]|uniref:hypothetical protein n=1 Tax=Streptomyces sp. NPDC005263 TaxID=3364711 RepID=UPI00367ED847
MSDTELTVTLSGGSTADARAVVRALEPAFGSARELPADQNATVHTATFDSSAADGPAAAAQGTADPLSAPVTVTVQGTPQAVEKASSTLARTFATHDQGSASGDQERERQLILEP